MAIDPASLLLALFLAGVIAGATAGLVKAAFANDHGVDPRWMAVAPEDWDPATDPEADD